MFKRQIATFLAAILFIALPLSTASASALDEAKQYVEQYYVGELTKDLNDIKTFDQLLEILDSYSDYFTKDEYNAFFNGVDNTVVGIGVSIINDGNYLVVQEVFEGGSAAKVQIQPGDTILSINGTSAVNMDAEDAVLLITGKENTAVTLQIKNSSGSTVTKTLIRKKLAIPTTHTELLYGNIGYISLNSFSEDAATQVANSIKKLQTQGATKFIFDLRNNGGGYVSAAEKIVGMFPNAKNAYILEEAAGTSMIRSISQITKFPENTKVLVNRSSASSSEITAGALKDQQAAILYGDSTYGKGSMQTFFNLEDGSYLKLTIGNFYGPSNTEVNDIGVEPNIKTDNALQDAHLDTILESYSKYKKLSSLTNVPVSKKFTVNFSSTLNDSLQVNTVELIHLGGQKVEISKELAGNKLIITPKQPLHPGEQYALFVHPGIKANSKLVSKKGYYTIITVAQ